MSDVDVNSLSQEDTDTLLAKLLEKKKQAEKKSLSTEPTKRATRKRTADEAPSGEPVKKRKKRGEEAEGDESDPEESVNYTSNQFDDTDLPEDKEKKREEAKAMKAKGAQATKDKEEKDKAEKHKEAKDKEAKDKEAKDKEAKEDQGDESDPEEAVNYTSNEFVDDEEEAEEQTSKKAEPKVGKTKAVKRPPPAEPEEAPAPKRRTRNAKLEALKKQMAEDKKKRPPPTFSDYSSEEDSGQDDDYSQSSDDDREPVPEAPTSLPDLSKTAPHGTPGNKSKNGIGQRHLLLKRVNRQLRQAHEEMEDHILRVGQLGDYDAGRHTRNVRLTLTVESYDTRGHAKDNQTFTLPNFEPDHIANLFRYHYNDQFKNITNANCMANHFTEEEIRTGKEIANPKDAGKIALQEFKKRNGGWTPKEFFGVDDKGRLKERVKYGKKPKRKKAGKTPRRDLNKADGDAMEIDS